MRSPAALTLLAALGFAAGCGSLGPTSDSSPPQVQIIAPAAGATVGRQVVIEALAADDFGVNKVRFLIDGVLLVEVFSAPYRTTWNPAGLTDGSQHTIRVEALDLAKNVTAQEIHVTFSVTQQAP
jgi:hypothetical protein